MARKPAQRFILLGLTLLVLLNGSGLFLLTYVQTGYHRIFVAEREEGEKQQLTMSAKEFRALAWIGRRDFIWDGKVYDCTAAVLGKNGRVILTCHYDRKETSIRDSVSENFENNREAPKHTKESVPAFPVFPIFGNMLIAPPYGGDTIAFHEAPAPAFEAPGLSLISPPPELG